MNQNQIGNGIFWAGATMLLAVQPVWADATPVTAVRLNQTQAGLEIFLVTQAGDRPQIFTTSQGNNLITNITNTQLRLSQGNSFRQDNPMPGINSVVVAQVDTNKVQVIVSGAANPPMGQILQNQGQGISLSFNPSSGNQLAQGGTASPVPASNSGALPTLTAQTQSAPLPPPPPVFPQAPTSQTPPPVFPQANPTTPTPPVAFPNPEIKIDGNPIPAAGAVQPNTPAPPFLPRAIAPPVGDISVSHTNASATVIDLGTAARVPRLVLRDAPVREVLSLLARSAGLNLAFASGQGATAPAAAPGGEAGVAGGTISLDLENESVQDAFNYVLQLSGLEANRSGRTIFVGAKLPEGARETVVRTLRLNQVAATDAANFLTSQGAETQIADTGVQIQTIGEGAAARTVETRTPRILALKATAGDAPLLLRGLAVSPDTRLNAVTLVGPARKVEIATAFLTQLDARRRQVAVNVRVVDVNLLGTEAFNSSFSFGVGDFFFNNDGGTAALNYGGTNPPSNSQVVGSVLSPAVIQNPLTGAVALNQNSTITIPNGGVGTRVLVDGRLISDITSNATFLAPVASFGAGGNPSQPVISSFTPGTPNTFSTTTSNGVTTTNFAAGTPASATFSLPTLFQYPTRFLSLLKAQITNGNAKILTDPTLVVQEGQSATVNLTQEVFAGTQTTFVANPGGVGTVPLQTPIIKKAGLILNIQVERIDDNGFVALAVNPIISAPNGTVTNATGDQITLIAERNLQSGQIRLRDGQTLILSGIIQESDRTTVTKIPILGDLPIIGALFRGTNRVNQRQEVIVLLTPQILDDSSRSTFGYNYTPSPNTRDLLQQRGFPTQGQ